MLPGLSLSPYEYLVLRVWRNLVNSLLALALAFHNGGWMGVEEVVLLLPRQHNTFRSFLAQARQLARRFVSSGGCSPNGLAFLFRAQPAHSAPGGRGRARSVGLGVHGSSVPCCSQRPQRCPVPFLLLDCRRQWIVLEKEKEKQKNKSYETAVFSLRHPENLVVLDKTVRGSHGYYNTTTGTASR